MLSRTASVGTPGGSRPRTRRSARSAAAAAAAASASPAPLLERAGPVVPATGSDGLTTGAADGTDGAAGQQRANKRPRTAAVVGLFTGDSLDDVGLPEAAATTTAVGGTDDPPATEQASADSSASSGDQQNDSGAKSPPTDPGASNAAQSATAAGSDQAAEEDKPDCGICLETCLHPVKLPCGHIFCYLCVKGAAKQSARCAYCRAEVTEKYINNPRLLDESEVEREMTDNTSYHWLYQGRNGWWRYDERTSRDIEEAFSAQEPSVQISVAGEMYTVEFGSMTQFNDECRGRRRRVRREAADATPDPTLRCKGVAGLRKKRRRQ